MKIVQINATCGIGSTGKICVGISRVLAEKNFENYILYSSKTDGYSLGIPCSDDRYITMQAARSKLLGNYGFNSLKATRKMIAELERIKPDIVHLHNIHGHDCNLDMLLTYFKCNKIKIVWTFHDCWTFTGYCTYFSLPECGKWRKSCNQCVRKKEYSLLFDKSNKLFEQKKKLFEGLDLTIVTPSEWLAGLVKESFLKNYPVYVINNGINLAVFRPTESNFRKKYGLEDKKIVLGVAFDWGIRKGLDVFVELAKRLPDDYKIILVGTDENADRQLPDNIISIHRTHNQTELAEIYTAADVLANPTREDNYPTVNMEAVACGIPVLTFRTGGSPEMLDETCGSVVECNDIDSFEKEIIRICTDKPCPKERCIKKSEEFEENERFKEYTDLYERIISAGNERN